MQKRHRIFIAINLPSDIKKVLAGYQKKWSDLPAKWVDKEQLHMTLLFLGDLTSQELGQVCIAVKEIVKNHNSFNVVLTTIAYGPAEKISFGVAQDKPPRYIWVGGKKLPELSALKKDLENALLEVVNIKPDNKLFSPHITLARINAWEWRAIEPEERLEISENIELTFTVESLEVMESELTRQGPRYTVIESHQLQ